MTGLTADKFGLQGRGPFRVGHAADVVVCDAAMVRDAADYESPTRPAEGSTVAISSMRRTPALKPGSRSRRRAAAA